jgi:hypothetical protein
LELIYILERLAFVPFDGLVAMPLLKDVEKPAYQDAKLTAINSLLSDPRRHRFIRASAEQRIEKLVNGNQDVPEVLFYHVIA